MSYWLGTILETYWTWWDCVMARAELRDYQQTLTITGVRSHAKSF